MVLAVSVQAHAVTVLGVRLVQSGPRCSYQDAPMVRQKRGLESVNLRASRLGRQKASSVFAAFGLRPSSGSRQGSLKSRVEAAGTEDVLTEGLELTEENVETVLDEVRPYLISDGGNVTLHEIDGLVVKFKL